MRNKNTKKLITTKELSKISGIKHNKIIGYIKKGILKYTKEDKKLNRYYNKNKALQRLKDIKRLENQGVDLKKMKEYFRNKDFIPCFMIIDCPETTKNLFKNDKEKEAYIDYIIKRETKRKENYLNPYYLIEISVQAVSKNFKEFKKYLRTKKRGKNLKKLARS